MMLHYGNTAQLLNLPDNGQISMAIVEGNYPKENYAHKKYSTEDYIAVCAASHNFIIVSGAQTFGLYFDYPSTITFDVGYTKCDELHIFCDSADLDIYVITGDSPYDITR